MQLIHVQRQEGHNLQGAVTGNSLPVPQEHGVLVVVELLLVGVGVLRHFPDSLTEELGSGGLGHWAGSCADCRVDLSTLNILASSMASWVPLTCPSTWQCEWCNVQRELYMQCVKCEKQESER